MKIVALSDTHNQHFNIDIPDGDILIHAGDAFGRGTYSDALRFNEWLGKLPHRYKIYVPGNHDLLFEDNEQAGRDVMTNAIVLINQGVEIEGLRIWGSPFTPRFYDWAFMKADHDLAPIWAQIPEHTDILITHGPPYDILDHNRQGTLCGSYTLKNEVIKKQPRVHLFGHIHEAAGELTYNGTNFRNVAILDDWYNFGRGPQTFELEPK